MLFRSDLYAAKVVHTEALSGRKRLAENLAVNSEIRDRLARSFAVVISTVPIGFGVKPSDDSYVMVGLRSSAKDKRARDQYTCTRFYQRGDFGKRTIMLTATNGSIIRNSSAESSSVKERACSTAELHLSIKYVTTEAVEVGFLDNV